VKSSRHPSIPEVIDNDETILGMSWGSFLSIMLLEMEITDKNFVLEIRERYEELVEAERERLTTTSKNAAESKGSLGEGFAVGAMSS